MIGQLAKGQRAVSERQVSRIGPARLSALETETPDETPRRDGVLQRQDRAVVMADHGGTRKKNKAGT
jgi:hypothetical protein